MDKETRCARCGRVAPSQYVMFKVGDKYLCPICHAEWRKHVS